MKPKSIHICNIANVAYGYCKLLEQDEHQVKLICHDIHHLMSQPEWDDLELNPDDFPDENNFHNNTVDFGGYRRPDWYFSEDLVAFQSALGRLIAPVLIRVLPRWARHKMRVLAFYARCLPLACRRCLRALVPRQGTEDSQSESFQLLERALRERCRALAKKSSGFGPEWALKESDFLPYITHAKWLEHHLEGHDVICACVLSPIYAMILGTHPYVSIEIGTMREIPFDGTVTGKLLALAYRLSDYVLITNPDVKQQAEQLGLKRYAFCPHPLDEEVYKPADGENEVRRRLKETFDADFILLAPARQNWFYKANDRMIRAFAKLLDSGVKAALLVPTWGQDIDKSQALARELGVDGKISWFKPLSERLLIKYMQAADVVLDQFKLGVFGLLSPKALACGKPVLTSYTPDVHTWCFDEHPPVVRCLETEEIFEALLNLANNPDECERVGRASRDWVLKHHSKTRIRTIMEEAMDQAQANQRSAGL